jgi:outer membrane protein OmpA-like peptidoglycan-associated protein
MDSIYDADDDCPKIWGLRAFNGCPDTDKDGIQDKMDDCPTVAGLADFKGCPDTDGDGIADKDDKCPGVAGLKEFAGCPDTDGDGTEDSKDKCPTKPGPVAGEGCPDTDGDGIYDNIDRCPDKPGVVALKGCPEMKQEVIAKMKRAAQGIFFETGKDVIKPESFKNLNDLVTILNDFPEASVEIQGHTDDVGADNANLLLSQSRANSVKKYLIEHGVSEGRLTANGYGETKPIADNKTAAGKALNRRVEFVLTY